jgi:hypothetical protein
MMSRKRAAGPVSEAIKARVLKQVEEHGLVVWFDPEKVYETVPDRLSKAGTTVLRFDGSVFELRRKVEPLLAGGERPHLVVYLPASDNELGAPLAELVAAGVALRPGQQPVALNTRLSVVARAALGGVLPPEALESVVRQVEGGQLGLGELDRLAESGATASMGTLSILFGTSHPADIALHFLADPSRDGSLVEKKAVADLEALLSVEYGLATKHATSPAGLRDRLALLVLSTDLVSSIGEEVPPSFKDLPRPERPELTPRVQELARTWRNRRDFQRSYVERALQVERDLDVASAPLPTASLARIETFRGLEEQLQDAVEAGLLAEATPSLLALAEARLQGFWASVVPELMDRWALVLAIGRVLVAADDVERELTRFTGKADAAAFAARYVGTEAAPRAWADLDMYHRQMERRYHVFDVDVTGAHRAIERLVAKARARYAAVASMLGDRFLRALYASKLTIAGVPRQAETFERFVRPAVDRGKVAYLLVDGLRYEMARELHVGIDREHDAALSFTLGTLPSITEVGMAALLPGAERGMELVAAGAGKLGVRLGDALVRNRKERLDFLERHAGVNTHSTKLEALLPPSKKTRDAISEAALVVVTATDELDGLCEGGNVAMARRLMDDVLLQVWRGLRVLFDLGVRTAIVTADHGHLFGETLDVGATIDAPGGQTVDLHRRVWVGKGGASSDSYLRMKASDVGLGGDLELAVPWALAAFKAVGASAAYFHGGASPQELLVPVWTVSRKAAAQAAPSAIAWRLTLGSAVVSARFLSVQIDGSVAGLFGVEAPLLRIDVRDAKTALSRPVASSYGFEEATGFVQMKVEEADGKTTVKPNTVTLFLESPPDGGTVQIVARDVATDRVVAKLAEVPVKLAGF